MLFFYCSRCIIILSLKNGWITMRRKTIDTIPVLSDAMKNILSAFSKSRSLPSGLVKRASIVLLASQGELNQNIASQVGLHYNNVATWRSRFLAALPALRKIEMDDPEKLEDGIRAVPDKRMPRKSLEMRYRQSCPIKGAPVPRLFLRRTRSCGSSTSPAATRTILGTK